MLDETKMFKVLGYRNTQQAGPGPDFEKTVYGRSEAARLAVTLRNSHVSFERVCILNHDGKRILDLEGVG